MEKGYLIVNGGALVLHRSLNGAITMRNFRTSLLWPTKYGLLVPPVDVPPGGLFSSSNDSKSSKFKTLSLSPKW
jgi:hypothetical protein